MLGDGWGCRSRGLDEEMREEVCGKKEDRG